VFVPLKHFRGERKQKLLSTELFGPFQIITEYGNTEFDKVVDVLEAIPANLTAAVVSNDQIFKEKLLGLTVNGTTYAGLRARTTGAP
jgi:1-pyrroline-5-carboxylate dehydrogenase